MITNEQWDIFRLTQQESQSKFKAATELGITVKYLVAQLDILKVRHPELFFCDSERGAINRKLSGTERKRYNHKVVSLHDVADEDIRQKF